MGPELGELAVNIVRWLDDSFPGFVACEFTDAAGRVHTIEDKVPMVSVEELDSSCAYPRLGGLRCAVLERWPDASGGELVRIDIAHQTPWRRPKD